MGASAAGVIVSVTLGCDHADPRLCFQAERAPPVNSLASNNRLQNETHQTELGGRLRGRLWKGEINRVRKWVEAARKAQKPHATNRWPGHRRKPLCACQPKTSTEHCFLSGIDTLKLGESDASGGEAAWISIFRVMRRGNKQRKNLCDGERWWGGSGRLCEAQTTGGLWAQHKQRACVLLNPTRPQRLALLLTKTQEQAASVCVHKYVCVCVYACAAVFV